MKSNKKPNNRKKQKSSANALVRTKTVNIFSVIAKKDVRYYASIYVLGTGGKQYSISSGGDVRYLTLGTALTTELGNVAAAYKYYRIDGVRISVRKIAPVNYAYNLPQLYVNVDMANSGGNPTNTNVVESTISLIVPPQDNKTSVCTWYSKGNPNWTIAVFGVWQATVAAPSQGAIVIGSDISGSSTTVDQIFVIEIITHLSLACNI